MRLSSTVLALLFVASCVDETAEIASDATVAHAALAPVMPPHLALMFSMSWFGIPKTGDPRGAGSDPGWGNWKIPGACSAPGAPATCRDGQRDVASNYRPLAGIYSATGRDDESRARIRLALTTLRRACANDVGARVDAFAIQLDGTHYTSLHSSAPDVNPQNTYQALLSTYAVAEEAGLGNAVLPADDAAWYWNNGHWFALDCVAHHETCAGYVQQDVIDMLTLAVAHPSSLRIAGKPVLYFYFDGVLKPDEWAAIFATARARVKQDFFALGSKQGAADPAYFRAFDGLSPWIDLDAWATTQGSTIRAHAAAYAAKQHDALFQHVPAGKVVFGGVAPGFDDFTNGWANCAQRHLPEGSPRDPQFLDGALDYLAAKHTRGLVLQTWDDWTEGSFFEPSTREGTAKLVQLQTRLGKLFGEPAVSSTALEHVWSSYGQARSCASTGAPEPSPVIDLCAASCSPVVIDEPTNAQGVGPSIHLRTHGPACLDTAIVYLDGVKLQPSFTSPNIETWIAVTPGVHHVSVNGWDANGSPYTSPVVEFTRTY